MICHSTVFAADDAARLRRIRNFYMRKVKFTQQNYEEKLNFIVCEFPKLDDIHPFYADLMNVLYDRDHYKLALGHCNTAKAMVKKIADDYIRLLKYGDSLYRCKMLKRAALGRMCTFMRKMKASLEYLEEVRKHLARLPSIDPNARTLLVCGYPNVGKSSFMNKVTRADVEVQPYAFTTKSLFVGHMDHKYLRWQVIDTPGILDHPLEDRNTIEMQSITALAHLHATVLYFCDISEQCGYTMAEQVCTAHCSLPLTRPAVALHPPACAPAKRSSEPSCGAPCASDASLSVQLQLFENIKPLFSNKPLVLVINKVDVVPIESISQEYKDMIAKSAGDTHTICMSNHRCVATQSPPPTRHCLRWGCCCRLRLVTVRCSLPAAARAASDRPSTRRSEVGVSEVKNYAADKLLEARVDLKLRGKKADNVLNRLHLAQPKSRDDQPRPAQIPEGAKAAKAAGGMGMGRKLMRDHEADAGGAGSFSFDLQSEWRLENMEWATDIVPEIMDGKNIADFIDPDILERLEELEREEELFEAKVELESEDELDEGDREMLQAIRDKKKMIRHENRCRTHPGWCPLCPLPSSPFQQCCADTTRVAVTGCAAAGTRLQSRPA